MLPKIFTDEQITSIREQALVFSCACPAQICIAIDGVRELHSYQANCIAIDGTDKEVHALIQEVAENNHAALEKCLSDVLRLEGWDAKTLKMPSDLKKNLIGG